MFDEDDLLSPAAFHARAAVEDDEADADANPSNTAGETSAPAKVLAHNSTLLIPILPPSSIGRTTK
jgi:hypothetical protein